MLNKLLSDVLGQWPEAVKLYHQPLDASRQLVVFQDIKFAPLDVHLDTARLVLVQEASEGDGLNLEILSQRASLLPPRSRSE